MAPGCCGLFGKKSTYDDFAERYAPKPKDESNNNEVNGIMKDISRNLSRSLSKPEEEPSPVISNNEQQPQRVVKQVRHGINWSDLEKNIQVMNLQLLREDLNENPQRFLINQILLSVQFFKNFER